MAFSTSSGKTNTPKKEDQRWSGWKHPNQPLPDEYTSSEQHENNKNKTTLIVGGIVLGLTALITYEIY